MLVHQQKQRQPLSVAAERSGWRQQRQPHEPAQTGAATVAATAAADAGWAAPRASTNVVHHVKLHQDSPRQHPHPSTALVPTSSSTSSPAKLHQGITCAWLRQLLRGTERRLPHGGCCHCCRCSHRWLRHSAGAGWGTTQAWDCSRLVTANGTAQPRNRAAWHPTDGSLRAKAGAGAWSAGRSSRRCCIARIQVLPGRSTHSWRAAGRRRRGRRCRRRPSILVAVRRGLDGGGVLIQRDH